MTKGLRQVVLEIALVIFFTEVAIMVGLEYAPIVSPQLKWLLDAALLTTISSPIIYFLFIKRFIQARDFAESASRAKSDFLSSMSHELRTPLNAIIGFSELMKDDPGEPLASAHQEYVSEIYKGGKHLLRLISDIIELSRIESGKMDVSVEPVRVAPLVQDCNALLATVATKYKVSLLVPEGIPSQLYVMADYTRLKQVLVNLITNAMKYNREGGTVQIAVTPEGMDGRVRISVKDTGRGISKENQAHLFQPFNRLGFENSSIEGTGVGLVLSQRLVKLMGGEIGVESEEGIGSTFWVSLPLTVAVEGETSAARSGTAAFVPASAAAKKRVLYIEDNPPNRMLMRAIMQRFPHIEFTDAPDAEIGLAQIESLHPDLVLLDISLPGMNGYQALEKLQQSEQTRHIPVVAVTANATKADIKRGEQTGFAGYLTKPISIKELRAVVDKYC